MSEKNSDLGAFLAGFVIGGLVGAATALILAPQSGEETRNKIKATSGQLTESGNAYIQEYSQKASEMAQTYQGKASTAVGDAKTRLAETGGRVQEQAQKVVASSKDSASQIKDQVAGFVQKSNGQGESSSSPTA